jgi:hypothetical protein
METDLAYDRVASPRTRKWRPTQRSSQRQKQIPARASVIGSPLQPKPSTKPTPSVGVQAGPKSSPAQPSTTLFSVSPAVHSVSVPFRWRSSDASEVPACDAMATALRALRRLPARIVPCELPGPLPKVTNDALGFSRNFVTFVIVSSPTKTPVPSSAPRHRHHHCRCLQPPFDTRHEFLSPSGVLGSPPLLLRQYCQSKGLHQPKLSPFHAFCPFLCPPLTSLQLLTAIAPHTGRRHRHRPRARASSLLLSDADAPPRLHQGTTVPVSERNRVSFVLVNSCRALLTRKGSFHYG